MRFVTDRKEGNVFRGVCHSVNRGMWVPTSPTCKQTPPPWWQTPLEADPPDTDIQWRPLQRSVHTLQECILVLGIHFLLVYYTLKSMRRQMSRTTQYSLNPAKFTADKIIFFCEILLHILYRNFCLKENLSQVIFCKFPQKLSVLNLYAFFFPPTSSEFCNVNRTEFAPSPPPPQTLHLPPLLVYPTGRAPPSDLL